MYIIFDLDGTLIDISNRFYKVYSDLMDKYDMPKLSCLEYIKCRKKQVSTKSILLKTTGDEEFHEKYLKERIEILETEDYLKLDNLYPESYRTLEELYGENKLILVTLRINEFNTIKQLRRLAIYDFFDNILIGDHFGNWKTKYDLLKNYDNNIIKGDGIIVGDTEIDIIAGKNLGIKTCFKQGGMRISKIVESENPDFIINDIQEIIKVIQNMNEKIH